MAEGDRAEAERAVLAESAAPAAGGDAAAAAVAGESGSRCRRPGGGGGKGWEVGGGGTEASARAGGREVSARRAEPGLQRWRRHGRLGGGTEASVRRHGGFGVLGGGGLREAWIRRIGWGRRVGTEALGRRRFGRRGGIAGSGGIGGIGGTAGGSVDAGSACGNGVTEPGEQCDLGPANTDRPAFLVTQGGSASVAPIDRVVSAIMFYGLASGSSHTGLEAFATSRVYLYLDTRVHSQPRHASGSIATRVASADDGPVVFDLASLPVQAVVAVTDDSATEFFKAPPSPTRVGLSEPTPTAGCSPATDAGKLVDPIAPPFPRHPVAILDGSCTMGLLLRRPDHTAFAARCGAQLHGSALR